MNINNSTERFKVYVVTRRTISLCQTNDSLHIHTSETDPEEDSLHIHSSETDPEEIE